MFELQGQYNRFYGEGRGSLHARVDGPASLWITCSDSIMNQALARALRHQPAMILRHSTDISRRHCVDVPKYSHLTIEFVKHQRVRHLVLCAHSSCPCFWQDLDDPSNTSSYAGGSDLLERVRRRELMNDHIRRQVIQQVQAWTDVPALRQQIGQRDVLVHGLFYLAESGIFTRYDDSHGTFVPIFDFTKLPDLLTSPESQACDTPMPSSIAPPKRPQDEGSPAL
jgi:carbonic anhydrase